MPRPKGSKNKKNIIPSPAAIQEQIETVAVEIESITVDIKAKKALLKQLQKDLTSAQKAAEERKTEETKQALLDAIAASGKSVDEILEMLR